MREKNPKKDKMKRLSITYVEGELDSKKIQYAAYNLGFGSMSKLAIDLLQKFMKKYEAEKNNR